MKQNSPLPTAILLIGPTGSGKTPLGEALEDLNYHHFDFGQQLRHADQNPGEFSCLGQGDFRVIHDALRSGALLTDEQFHIAAGILKSFIASRSHENRTIIMNGLPRHIGQADAVAELVDITGVIHLECDTDTVRQRIRKNSGGDRADRKDDSTEEIEHKLKIFRDRTRPLLDYYRGRGADIIDIEINVDTQADAIIAQYMTCLKRSES